MEFIKQMRKREFIEMGLKATAALLAAFLAIILMEGMIYGIQLNALMTVSKGQLKVENQTVAYCIKEAENKYFVIYFNDNPETKGFDRSEWSAKKGEYLTEQECLDLTNKQIQQDKGSTVVKEVHMHAPNAFSFSITTPHFFVMGAFILIVAGFFVYKFISLGKEYVKIQTNFEKNGTIEIG